MKTRSGEPLPEHLKAQIEALEAMSDESIDYSDAPSLDDWSGAVRGRFANKTVIGPRMVKLPEAVARLLAAVEELKKRYEKYGRKFTLDGHLVGEIGEVVAAEELGLKLHPPGHAKHDAYDSKGEQIQIKMTWGHKIAMYSKPDRLVVLRAVSSEEAEIVYDGPGQSPWEHARENKNNRQHVVSLARLRSLQLRDPHPYPLPEGEGAERKS